MGAFDDEWNDPFEDIVRNFFGGSSRRPRKQSRELIEGEEEERTIDFVEDKDYTYLIFELPGYEQEDVTVTVQGNELNIEASKGKEKMEKENVVSYLKEKLSQRLSIVKPLPKNVNPKNFKSTVRSGILEVIFAKR